MSPPTSVRLPESLRDRVSAIAESERRSFHNTLVVVIELGLDAWAKQAAAPMTTATPAAEPIRTANGPGRGAAPKPSVKIGYTLQSCPRRRQHRKGTYCKTCGLTP